MFKESPVEADDELLRPQRGGVVESGEGVLNSCCFGCCSHETRISTGFQFNSIGSTFRQQLYKGWEFLHIPLTSTIIILFVVPSTVLILDIRLSGVPTRGATLLDREMSIRRECNMFEV